MKKIKASKRFYKNTAYTFSPIRGCWKIYHSSQESFMALDFETEKEVKIWINKKSE